MALPAIAGLTGRGANDDVTSCIEAVAGSRKVGQLARGPVRRPPLDQPVGSKPSTPSSPGSWSVKAPLVDSPAWWHTETTSGSASGVEFPSANPAVLAVALVGAEQRIRLVQDVKGAASTPRATTGESTSPARTWMLIGSPMICLTRAPAHATASDGDPHEPCRASAASVARLADSGQTQLPGFFPQL